MKKLLLFFGILWATLSQAQTVTIIQPNGGEMLYACQTYTVKWSQSGSFSNYWNIDYSLDGGTIWTSVTSNFLSSNGQFVWTIPNVQSSIVLMRVRDALNLSLGDQSDAYFTINIPIVLTAPNGGEVWQGNSVQNITWNAQGTSNTYSISYSTNGGSSWSTINGNYASPTGVYTWTVPNIPSTTCLVRVMDRVSNCMQDVSDATFTITPAVPVLITPNGGESIRQGCTYNITWNAASFFSTVRLEYSLNNGTSWTPIVTGATNNGSYNWTVPILGAAQTQCLVKASNSASLSINDVSDATFTLPVALTVTNPNGGETLTGCNSYSIIWSHSNCITSYSIAYSTDAGSSWIPILGMVGGYNFTVDSYVWTVPDGISSTQCRIKVTNSNGYSDISDADFSIQPNRDITVTAPNGGETIAALSTYTLTWSNLPGASGRYGVQYSTDNGSSWNTIATNYTGNAYVWTVPNTPGTQCLFRVYDYNNGCKIDVSDAVFSITPATPILLTPNGGETIRQNCSYNITWNASTFFSPVRLEYSLNNGTTWTPIVTGATNNGSYNWTVPSLGAAQTQCLIKASNSASLSINDVSNATFTIPIALTVTSPNGGETLTGCNSYPIIWSHSNCINSYSIAYSTDAGSTWIPILGMVSGYNSIVDSYIWSVPDGISSTQCRIKVTNNSGYSDISDANFSIQPNRDITVTSPNGGETIAALSTYTLTWSNLPGASGTYALQYSTNNGSSWTTIANNITGNAYIWSVPNVSSTQCLFRVYDFTNSCKMDASDAVFSITPPTPVLLKPNGGETIRQGCVYTITWDASTFFSPVRLEYSLNNGTTWTPIVTGATNNGSYNWTVPILGAAQTQCLVKASNSASLSINDVSDATFTIPMALTVTNPNGGETLTGCNSYSIIWSHSNCITSYSIAYSTDAGATWIPILGMVGGYNFTVDSYVWTVPDGISSTQCRIKVTNSNGYSDISDADFSIQPNRDITVTAPNGGETIAALSTYTLIWSNLPGASGRYGVQYSTDNGSSWNTIATNYTGNSYVWTVPNTPGTQCLFRVYDYNNGCKIDVSDAVFSITPATPILLTPNGGETIRQNCSYNITWNASTFFSPVRLEYSLNNGTTWTPIVTGATNNGSYNWTVPILAAAQTQCLIKASNSASLSINDVSNATFTIPIALTVTSPNGGETLTGCNSYPIIWSHSNCITSYSIAYSTDAGSTWIPILGMVSGYNSIVDSYIWSVPNGISSTQCRFKVTNSNGVSDISDADFSIQPSNDITVLTPNGGESIVGLSTYTITWANQPTASGLYNVQFSANNGSSWTNLATNISGNAYIWNVPNVPGNQYLVKVTDYNNSCKYDISNSTFTVTPATPILLMPNGGETLTQSCSYIITWDAATFFSNVKLEYSFNGGSTWNNIIASTSNNGSYGWTVPGTGVQSQPIIVRASNTASLTINDVSNAPANVVNALTVTSPNGGETFYGCNTYQITFNRSSCITTYSIDLSLDGGATWDNLLAPTNFNTGNSGLFTWQVPNGISSTQCRIRVTNPNGYSDISDADFSIQPSNDITVTAPNGGENLVCNTTYTLSWTNLPTASGQYNLLYSTNNGSSWTTIANNVTGNAYIWTVPPTPGNQCLVKVVDYINNCKFDISNATFSITPPTPILINPNGGQVYSPGVNYNIVWNAASFFSPVKLEYSTNNGLTWNLITSSTPNDGVQGWTVPAVASTQCLIRASNTASLSLNDVSDATFTITPAVTVLTPNGDNGVTIWGGCTVTSITFDHSPAWSNYLIEYSLNNGNTWITINSSWPANGYPATYNWSIPNAPSTQAKVRVSPVGFPTYADQSDNTFTITQPVTIIQPNFGGIMQAGTVYPIKWQSDGISNIYDIFYSTNGGTTFTPIVTGFNTSTNTYSWTVPSTVSNNCRIIVRDNINTCKTDTSDQAFIIQSGAPAITLLTPNGQETLSGCSTYGITWNDSPTIGTYNLAYSTNSGASWNTIVSNYSTSSHSYNWVVPNTINSSNVLLRIQSTASTSVLDLSDALLSIVNGSLSATPNYTAVCAGTSVPFTATGGSNYAWAPAAGLTATNVPNPVASPGTTTTYTVQSNNGGCILQDTVRISVTPPNATPSIVISANPSATICPGLPVTFAANILNGGTVPGYQWLLNGNPVSTAATYSSNSISNNDVVSCTLSSTLGCITTNTASSNAITMNVVTSVTPSVSITASATGSICSGSLVTFSATTVFGGSAPAYQWKKNGANIATTPTYTSNTLLNGDVISLVLTSNAPCLSTTTATSNAITIQTSSVPATPAAISGSTTVCASSGYVYSITPVALADTYTWNLPSGWSGSSNTYSISVNTFTNGGTLSVSASNACGTSTTRTLSVGVSIPVLAITGNSVICAGKTTTLTASGATTYTWSTGQTGAVITVTPATETSYTVTGSNAAGCSASAVRTVTVNALPLIAISNPTVCAGTTATLIASGANSYTWSTGATGANLVVTPGTTTTYTANGTSSLSCVGSNTVQVTVNALPVIALSSTSICAGSTATLTASGADTYTWSTGANGSTINVSPASTTNYTVTGTSTAGCSKTATSSVSVQSLPSVNISSATVCPGSTATLTATGANTYTWNTGVVGNTLSVVVTGNATYTATGTNTITGCSNTGTGTVSVAAVPAVGASSATICAGQTATLTATGASSYTWSTGATGANLVVTPTGAASYTVTGKNAQGCSNTATASVTVNALPVVTSGSATICAGSSVTLTASGADTYTWSTGATGASLSLNPTASTNYTVTGTSNSTGCRNTAVASVSVNAAPAISVNAPTVCTGGSATLTATGATSYTWSTGDLSTSTVVTPSGTTSYTVTGKNAAGCTSTQTTMVTVSGLPTISINSPTLCAGRTATLIASGASTYTWSTGATGASLSVSPASNATYSVTGTNAAGCSNTATTSVAVNPLPVVTASTTAICAGNTATLNAGGANTYTWSTGANGSTLNVSPATSTSYTVTGTDNTTGCFNTAIVTATVNAAPSLSVNAPTICAGATATLTASGANTYTWSNGDLSATTVVTPSGNTSYTVTGQNALGCSATATTMVRIEAPPTITLNAPAICAGSQATLNATGAVTYTWSTGATGASLTVSPVANTNYTVTGSSALGCTNTATTMVTVGNAPSIVVNSATVCAGSPATLIASGVDTYSWSNGATTASIAVMPLSTTAYTVQGTLTGCSVQASSTTTVTVNALPPVAVSATPTLICTGQSAQLSASGASSYTWSTGATGSPVSVSPAANATYTVTGEGANGCRQNAIVTVSVSTCTDIESLTANTFIQMYPNPATDQVTIRSSNALRSVTIIDMLGKVVYEAREIHDTSLFISLDPYRVGMYYVLVQSDTQQQKIKLVKE